MASIDIDFLRYTPLDPTGLNSIPHEIEFCNHGDTCFCTVSWDEEPTEEWTAYEEEYEARWWEAFMELGGEA
jgi:hypothetical protein